MICPITTRAGKPVKPHDRDYEEQHT